MAESVLSVCTNSPNSIQTLARFERVFLLHEIRWHGRAGQGIITASRILAHAAVLDGKHAQAFPEFGPERLGAPISGFTRISDDPILLHSQIYYPSIVIVLEKSLLSILDVTRGISKDGVLLINAKDRAKFASTLKMYEERVYAIDADSLSRQILGRLAPNTAMIGALNAIRPVVSLPSVREALNERFGATLGEANFRLVEEASRSMGSRVEVVKA